MTTLPNHILEKLLDYQKAPTWQLVRALLNGEAEWGYPGAADLSAVGTGKTYMDLAAILAIGRKPVILCPPAGLPGWMEAFAHFEAQPFFIGTPEACKLGSRREIVRRYGASFEWQNADEIAIIFDEAQAFKGMSSLASFLADGAISQKIPILCASATLASSPLELRIAGRVTGLHTGGSDWARFLVEHGCHWQSAEECGEELGRWVWDSKKYAMGQLHHTIVPRRGCRVRKEDMGQQAGSTMKTLPLECEGRERIENEWRKLQDQLKSLEIKHVPKVALLAVRRRGRMRLWKESELALVGPVSERIKTDLDNGRSVIVFFSFTESRIAMGRIFKTRAGLYGGQSQAERDYIIREFQANRTRLLLCNIGAGGAAVNLQDKTGDYPRTTYIFPSDSAKKMGQAPGRTDRQGSQSHSLIFIVCVKGTLSQQMVYSTARKVRAMEALNDGD